MGIATSTAIAIGTSVAAAGASAVTAVRAGQDARNASSRSNDAFEEAMNRLSVNRLAGIGLPMEARDRQIEANLAAGAEATQAGRESERGAAVIAGQVFRGQTEAQRNIAEDLGDRLMGLETATAQEEANLDSAKAGLNLAEAEGAQKAAAQFGAQKDAAITNAFSSLQSAGQQFMQGSELFKSSKGANNFDGLLDQYNKAAEGNTLSKQFLDPKTNKAIPFNTALSKLTADRDVASKLGSLKGRKLQDYLNTNPDIMRSISGDVFSRGYDSGMDISGGRRNLQTSLNSFTPSFNINPFGN